MSFGENRKKDFLLKDILEFKTVLNEFLQGKFIFVKFSEIFLIVKISFNWLLHVLTVIGDFSKHSWSAYPVGLLNTGYYNQMMSGSPAEAICLVPTLCHTLLSGNLLVQERNSITRESLYATNRSRDNALRIAFVSFMFFYLASSFKAICCPKLCKIS